MTLFALPRASRSATPANSPAANQLPVMSRHVPTLLVPGRISQRYVVGLHSRSCGSAEHRQSSCVSCSVTPLQRRWRPLLTHNSNHCSRYFRGGSTISISLASVTTSHSGPRCDCQGLTSPPNLAAICSINSRLADVKRNVSSLTGRPRSPRWPRRIRPSSRSLRWRSMVSIGIAHLQRRRRQRIVDHARAGLPLPAEYLAGVQRRRENFSVASHGHELVVVGL